MNGEVGLGTHSLSQSPPVPNKPYGLCVLYAPRKRKRNWRKKEEEEEKKKGEKKREKGNAAARSSVSLSAARGQRGYTTLAANCKRWLRHPSSNHCHNWLRHTHTHTHTHARIHTRTHTRTHAHTHTCTHTHTHIHTLKCASHYPMHKPTVSPIGPCTLLQSKIT